MQEEQKALIVHGFSKQELASFMSFVKKNIPGMKDVIFATTTPTSLEWKLKDLIEELAKEHNYMKNNPPQGKGE